MIETRFKQTEIGLIPEDWEVVKIDDLFDIGNGYTPSKSISSYWENGTIPWFRMEDIRTNGRILQDSIQHVTMSAVKSGGLFPAYSIILSTTATIGEHALLIVDSLANQQFSFLIRKPNRCKDIDIRYFFYYCFILGNWCRANINDGGLAAVNMKDLKNHAFAIPTLILEQQRIAAALSDIDALISALDKKIAKKKLIKQGVMQQLLTGTKRLPGFTEPWVEMTLESFCAVKRGVRVVKNQLQASGLFPVFQNTNIPLGFYNMYNVTENTPFVIIGGSAGQVGICHTKYWAADDCVFFECKTTLLKHFLYYVLLHNQKVILQNVRQGTVPRLDRAYLQKMEIKVPVNTCEQTAIAEIISDMDKEISDLVSKKSKYEQIKQGMMQQLLTGKIRSI